MLALLVSLVLRWLGVEYTDDLHEQHERIFRAPDKDLT